MKTNDEIRNSFKTLQNKLVLLAETYCDLINFANVSAYPGNIIKVKNEEMLARALTLFGPQIKPSDHQLPLHELYELAIHLKTGAIIVASRSSTFSSKTTILAQPFVTHFQTFAVYMLDLGIEVATVGRIGDVSSQPYVLRSESTCTPSFLFGSAQCNCASQWRCTQELAAYFNSNLESVREKIGFLMIHLESQHGMGMGYSQDTFAIDLGTRAHLRHGAGLAASQHHQLSIQEMFDVMGLPQDPRRASDGAAYKITPILLDFLGTHAEPILLSNNPMKIQALNKFGYSPQRLKILGEITVTGQREAMLRSQTLDHLDIGAELTSFHTELERLKKQIQTTYHTRRTYVN